MDLSILKNQEKRSMLQTKRNKPKRQGFVTLDEANPMTLQVNRKLE